MIGQGIQCSRYLFSGFAILASIIGCTELFVIQNKNTNIIFTEHHIVFHKLCNSGAKICNRWNDNGTTGKTPVVRVGYKGIHDLHKLRPLAIAARNNINEDIIRIHHVADQFVSLGGFQRLGVFFFILFTDHCRGNTAITQHGFSSQVGSAFSLFNS